MYRLANIISTDVPLNLISEVAFSPDGALFAATHQRTDEVIIYSTQTRKPVRVFNNPAARLDYPHGILLTAKHLIVSSTHNATRPSTFTVYRLDDNSNTPVSYYSTPYTHLREAHSLALHNGILAVTYCQSATGPGAVVIYRFDDESGAIEGPVTKRELCFELYGEPKGVAFDPARKMAFVTYSTQKPMSGFQKYLHRAILARNVLQTAGFLAFLRHVFAKFTRLSHPGKRPPPALHNGIAMFAIDDSGEWSEQPVDILVREKFCRLENIAIVGDNAVLSDTINGEVHIHNLRHDPQLRAPALTVSEGLQLPHGAKLSPDEQVLLVTNYGLKNDRQVIYWQMPSSASRNALLVYDLVSH